MQYEITNNAINFTRQAPPGGRQKRVYPFPAMAVGDGFQIPRDRKGASIVMAAACDFVRRHKPEWKFSKRTDADGNKWCVRIK